MTTTVKDGNVTVHCDQYIVINGGNHTFNFGSSRSSYKKVADGDRQRCPISLPEYKAQLPDWAVACIGVSAPDGWKAELWRTGSPNLFPNKEVPQGLSQGDPLFFWKMSDDIHNESIPDGFEAAYASEDCIIIIKSSTDGLELNLNFNNSSSDNGGAASLDSGQTELVDSEVTINVSNDNAFDDDDSDDLPF
jgi:hypothetical protein